MDTWWCLRSEDFLLLRKRAWNPMCLLVSLAMGREISYFFQTQRSGSWAKLVNNFHSSRHIFSKKQLSKRDDCIPTCLTSWRDKEKWMLWLCPKVWSLTGDIQGAELFMGDLGTLKSLSLCCPVSVLVMLWAFQLQLSNWSIPVLFLSSFSCYYSPLWKRNPRAEFGGPRSFPHPGPIRCSAAFTIYNHSNLQLSPSVVAQLHSLKGPPDPPLDHLGHIHPLWRSPLILQLCSLAASPPLALLSILLAHKLVKPNERNQSGQPKRCSGNHHLQHPASLCARSISSLLLVLPQWLRSSRSFICAWHSCAFYLALTFMLIIES